MATSTNTKATPITPAIASARVMAAADHLLQITTDLSDAQVDAARYERLMAARARVESLTVAQREALAEQNTALSNEAELKAGQRFANITGIDITDITPDENVLRSAFGITYTTLKYDMTTGGSVPTPVTSTSFRAIPAIVLDYLIEVHPSKVPSKIMALAPTDPRAAFERYFVGLRRGCLTS